MHGLSESESVDLSAYLRLYVCLSVCLKVCIRLPVTDGHGHGSGCLKFNLLSGAAVVTVTLSVCPHSRHSPPTGVCLSESVFLSVRVSESACLRVYVTS